MSEAGEEVCPEFTLPESPIVVERRAVRAPNTSFAVFSGVDLKICFTFRACVMRTVPHIMKGSFRLAIRTALEKILAGHGSDIGARRVEGVHALAEDVALPSTSWRACSKEALRGKGAPFPGRPVVAVVGTESGE